MVLDSVKDVEFENRDHSSTPTTRLLWCVQVTIVRGTEHQAYSRTLMEKKKKKKMMMVKPNFKTRTMTILLT